jgi:hypothetical protein
VSRGWAELSPGDDGPECLTIGEENLDALFRTLLPDVAARARVLAADVRRDGAQVAARHLLALVERPYNRAS